MNAESMNVMPKVIAVFDYDGTLTTSESFKQFLSLLSSPAVFYYRLIEGVLRFFYGRWRGVASAAPDPSLRTFVKHHLIKSILAGRRADSLTPAVKNLHAMRQWNHPVYEKLLYHHVRGDHIVIATGGLDLYIYELLSHVPHHAVICTEVAVVDGVVTDSMPRGNCTHTRKAERLRQYMAEHGPFDDSFGYGNAPHDLEMLKLLNHQMIV